MTAQTSAGTILSISAGIPATEDQAGYEALTFTAVGEVTDAGEYGKVFNLVTHNPLATRRTEKFKGSFNEGSITLQMAEDRADAGQVIVKTAADSDENFSFSVTAQDGGVDYFQAKVMSRTSNVGSVDNIRTSSVQLEITSAIVEVAP